MEKEKIRLKDSSPTTPIPNKILQPMYPMRAKAHVQFCPLMKSLA